MLVSKAQPRGSARAAVSVTAFALACMLAASVAATGASAEEIRNHLYDRYQFGVSGSQLRLGSDVRVDRDDGSAGTDLNFGDDLGLSRNKFQPRMDFRWRPGRKHEIGVSYQFVRRSADKTLDRTIIVGDTTFSAGLQVHSVFNTDNAVLAYRYSFKATERTQLGAAVGLGMFFFKVGMDGLVSASGGGQSGSADYSVSKSFKAPTMSLGLFGRFRAKDHWYFLPDVRYLQFTIDRFTPRILEGGVATQYYVSDRFGLEAGFGFRGVKLDIGPRPEDTFLDIGFTGSIKYTESQLRFGVVLPL